MKVASLHLKWEHLNDKSINVISDNYLLNVNVSITKAYTDFTFCLLSLHTHLEGTMSKIFYLSPSFFFFIS